MTESILINNLAGLLIVTSLMVIMTRKATRSVIYYAVQSLILVLIFILIGNVSGASQLYIWAGTAFVTKVVLIPAIIYWGATHLTDPKVEDVRLHPTMMLLIAAAMVLLSYFAVQSVNMKLISHNNEAIEALKPVLTVSLGYFMLGVLCIVMQRNILKQIFGYCLMDNGAHLMLALLANQASGLVEIGVATDAIFAVVVMTLLVRRIYNTIHTLDANELTSLKG